MALHFNESAVAPVVTADGVARQPLLNKRRVPDILFALDRFSISPGGQLALTIAPDELAWFQMIDGAAALHSEGRKLPLAASHVGLLPPGFAGTLVSDAGATLLLATVPDAGKIDPAIGTAPPPFRIVDWQDEPLLHSEQDDRKRIYIITPKMFGTRAIRGEMIIYPPGTECPVHHHQGGAHFMYFLAGQGTCYGSAGQVMTVRQGDIVYYRDLEPHWVKGGAAGDMIFSEFFVPSAVATVWDDPSQVCTWVPTGMNRRGGTPARMIERHVHSHLADV